VGESTAVLSSPRQETWPFELSYDNRELGMLITQQASIVRAHKSPKKLGMSSSSIQLPSLQVMGLATSCFRMASRQHIMDWWVAAKL